MTIMIIYFILVLIIFNILICISFLNDCNLLNMKIDELNDRFTSFTEKINNNKNQENSIIKNDENKQNHRLAVDSNSYFRFLYDYSPIGVLRVRQNGLSENYNQRLSQIFSKMITMYGESMDSIVCYVIAHSLYEIFSLNDKSKIKNIKMSKMINFVELDQILKIDVLIERDSKGSITYFNFFVNDDVDTLINNRENIEEYRFFNNSQTVKENFKFMKTEMISKIFEVKK